MTDKKKLDINSSPLGQKTSYADSYDPQLLFAIERQSKRLELGVESDLPFHGEDIWNAYELSWLNPNGLPQVAVAEIRFVATSPIIVESKSFKLYLNSFNQTHFNSMDAISECIQKDLSQLTQSQVVVKLFQLSDVDSYMINHWQAICLEQQAKAKHLKIDGYQYQPELLQLDCQILDWAEIDSQNQTRVSETLCSHLLKSNCLITHQPDWASLYIQYKGQAINHQSLLAYIVSFRDHNEFHEQCVERIFVDIMQRCQPQELTVYARYTRRGGLDINPWRSNHLDSMGNCRLIRQ
ncbi:MAG: NADPH-dependent 7-cyano-7-deazaguanine reductase QueF [Enterobacterales bacterium]|nr:NADPH-dependent 7-cyano-7-deazaguanine reductase QueF [Enterobacterales bacterium]